MTTCRTVLWGDDDQNRISNTCITQSTCQSNICDPFSLFIPTSRHTKASNGSVVNMFMPNANRATLIKVLSAGKLFRMLPKQDV